MSHNMKVTSSVSWLTLRTGRKSVTKNSFSHLPIAFLLLQHLVDSANGLHLAQTDGLFDHHVLREQSVEKLGRGPLQEANAFFL